MERFLRNPEFLENFISMQKDLGRARPFNARIVGRNAKDVKRGVLNDCVAVGRDGDFFCTGTLITERIVLTASHCTSRELPNEILIGTNTGSGETYDVTLVYRNPQSQWATFGDIALLLLDRPVDPAHARPRRLATAAEFQNADYVWVAGFGYSYLTSGGQGAGAGRKRAVTVAIHPGACGSTVDCSRRSEFVAASIQAADSDDTCNGDSGGPAYVVVGDRLALAGVTSAGVPVSSNDPICGRGGIYGNCTAPDVRRRITDGIQALLDADQNN